GDFAQIDGEHFDLRAESGNIAHALHQLDPIFALAQIQSGRGTQVFHHQRRVFRLDIHTGSDGATANPQVTQIIGGIDYALQTPPQRTRVCLELLAQSYRHCVLKMGAAGFQDVIELPAFLCELTRQQFDGPAEAVQLHQTRKPDRSWYHVVGRLRHVDVIVRMHRRITAARRAKNLIGSIGEDFVDVHV